MIYTSFSTCKAKGVNPYEWLIDTRIKIPAHLINRIHELLPGDILKNEV
ncbi:MAG: transposase domain-containing protein [Saprospiraceae bacterium]|nr:transposase domain-containing protein [Saprospiraceae bacterium]